ncbi:MAG: class I SAM-dependent methyltransferase [Arenimonas sp.]|nr:class I SAM-dependent methyltransferase [Arenimonas sp.]
MSGRELIRLSGLPVYQNKMFPTAQAARACERGDMVLVQDDATGLVHNQAFDQALLSYDESYQNEQAHSTAFKAHLDEVMALVGRHFSGGSILEVGCGKGDFLDRMRQQGLEATGIDPAYEGDSPYILRAGFAPGIGVGADAVVMRHTLEHIPDPIGFLDLIRRANDGRGLVYIEVPCLDWILDHHAWFDIFYEHVNYFRLADFHRLFGRVLASGRLFGGQYLYAVADLASLRAPAELAPAEAVSLPPGFFAGIDRCVAMASRPGRKVVWGAAAKGVMFAHHVLGRGMALDFAIDINPAKQSGHLAGTGLEVLSPEAGLARLSAGDQVFVMNSNYLGEIVRAGGDSLQYIALDTP